MKKLFAIVVIVIFLGMTISPSIIGQTAKKQNIKTGMKINFFEEFPTEDNLRKAELIDFPSIIYIAATSLEEFKTLEETLHDINPLLDVGYWPILEKSYWISPFSYTYELINLIEDIQKNNHSQTLKILLDLEPPINNITLFIINLFSFFENKRLIEQLFDTADELNIKILTAEYPARTALHQYFLELLGLSYPIEKYPHNMSVLYYSSTLQGNPFFEYAIKEFIIYKSNEYGQNFHVGLGAIAKGVFNQPILSPENLDEDLNFLDINGIKTAYIYRLGGLNEDYVNIIKNYL